MIISRTPFRISFFGGGTDYPEWYNQEMGQVLSVAINKYCYISIRALPPFFKYKYRFRYFKNEEINDLNKIEHPSIRETLKFLNFNKGIELVHSGDLPAMSGLGSSSSFTVGLLNALYSYSNKKKTKRQIANDAIEIEQNLIQENVGSQDQVAASFGGLNKIIFKNRSDIIIEPLTISSKAIRDLQDHIVLIFTGFSRIASNIAKEQIQNISKYKSEYREMVKIVDEAEILLYENNIHDFGKLLIDQWNIKKKLSKSISTSKLDLIYDHGIKNGASGGKLLGAGGGGFILFLVEPDKQQNFIKSFDNFLNIPIEFDMLGSQIIYFTKEE